jgi:hypothetical protein
LERSAVADVAAGCDAGVVGVHRRAWWCEGHGMPCPYCCKYIRRATGGQCRSGRGVQHICKHHNWEVGNAVEDRVVRDKQRTLLREPGCSMQGVGRLQAQSTQVSRLFPYWQRGWNKSHLLGAQKISKQGF